MDSSIPSPPSSPSSSSDLASLLIQVSHGLSFAESTLLCGNPSSRLLQHCKTTASLVDGLQQVVSDEFCSRQNPINESDHQLLRDSKSNCRVNTLMELDILRLILMINRNLTRLLAVILAETYGVTRETSDHSHNGVSDHQTLRLLKDERADESGKDAGTVGIRCLDRLLPLVCSFASSLGAKRNSPPEISISMTIPDVAQGILTETVSALEEQCKLIALDMQGLKLKLRSTADLLKKTLIYGHGIPSFVSSGLFRRLLLSFLNHGAAVVQSEADIIKLYKVDKESIEYSMFYQASESVIEKLLDPQGPSLIGIGGCGGIGKSCLACQVTCDPRISSRFLGGVFYLEVGCEPDLNYLQTRLWKKMSSGSICCSTSSSRASFSSQEEGLTILKERMQDRLPSLIVLDSVHDPEHVKSFMCFESKDKGRILVVSSDVNRALAPWKTSCFIQQLKPLDEKQAVELLNYITTSNMDENVLHKRLSGRCAGIPHLIQAVASTIFYQKEAGVDGHPFLSPILEQSQGPDDSVTDASAGDGPGYEHAKDNSYSVTYPIFSALSGVHPSLQECFLDLSAFPKGQWISLSTLVNIWGLGDGMEKEIIFVILCLLASQSIVQWRLEPRLGEGIDILNSFDDDNYILEWRLANDFYDLAQVVIGNKFKEASDIDAPLLCCEDKQDPNYFENNFRVLHVLGSSVDALRKFSGLKQRNRPLTRDASNHLRFSSQVFNSRQNIGRYTVIKLKTRLFAPGWHLDQCPPWWIKGNFANIATKLSLVSGSTAELIPSNIKLPSVKIALLSHNLVVKKISESAINCMERLVILDLKGCKSLSSLPDSVVNLKSLEFLDLSNCMQLISLPKSVGKLRNLKSLNLSDCMCLTHLPNSFGKLLKLEVLNLSGCVRLKLLPKTIGQLVSLQKINLFGCYSLLSLPASIAYLRGLTSLVLSGCSNLSSSLPLYEQLRVFAGQQSIRSMAVPIDCWKLGQMEVLHLCSLKYLTYLPRAIGKLQHLQQLNISSCRSLEYLPDELGSLFLLERLDISHTAVRKLPNTISQLNSLSILCLRGCSRLLCIPPPISTLPKLEVLELAECWDLVMLPSELGNANSLPSLLRVDLSGCSIKQLPMISEGALPKLQELHLVGCENLFSLPENFGKLTSLEKVTFEGCKSLTSLDGVGFGELKQLKWCSLRNCLSLSTLPVSELQNLKSLKFLDASGCSGITPFPEPLLKCAREGKFTLVRWGAVWQ